MVWEDKQLPNTVRSLAVAVVMDIHQHDHDHENDELPQRDRLPSFAEVLSRRTRPPVDLYML